MSLGGVVSVVSISGWLPARTTRCRCSAGSRFDVGYGLESCTPEIYFELGPTDF